MMQNQRLIEGWIGNNRRCLPDRRKGMRRPGEIENVKKKTHASAKKVL